ncbi:hypothetical protein RHODO2019_19105 (plasmid) [Rhodococcus antarcticus]|jgi:hypothetical protein|uniref:Uncharacterized protein n=1 Tax=Rhodococcus antarcticus TaxID=2987751 RepID=A0ABY6P5V4_9NOCA|nr:hypothetical protein [Rhodococcus antarcticus]UZJ27039.1 hypothetical protein RHODO2019_19105 [Rhodococcus antarcticus]
MTPTLTAAVGAAAADSTALTVVHTTEVEGHLPLPGTTVLRSREQRPWLVHSIIAGTAILTDLAGGVIQVALTSLHPDQVDSPTDPTAADPNPTDTSGPVTQGHGIARHDASGPDLG